ncbi:galactokinase [Desertivirga brevis]|uniref:galactokinase n=1 Tax=Desertivirga brevis TaxID=2810310 RepID=UPI001A975D4C|nr:galactokinase [Pedobacter sp. SYSU D00873]
MSKLKKVVEKFRELHKDEPLVVRSPGRINLIGEHTDYNMGYVLPGAIEKNVFLAIGLRPDMDVNIFAADYGDHYVTSLDGLTSAWKLWPNYILGVLNELKKRGVLLCGVNIVLGGDIPLAAGMSSSAAVTCATAFALNEVFDLGLSKIELAKLAQAAEHDFVGVKCGLMDQFASLHGKKDHLIKLNCKTNEFEYIPFNSSEVSIVLFDTGVKHHLISSAYNDRRSECQRGIDIIKQNEPAVKDLADVTDEMLDKYLKLSNPLVYNRCLYVVEEMTRLKSACGDLERNNYAALGGRMFETHHGLKHLYEVSCKECDFLVDFAVGNSYVMGARMMGGGFGGCTINLISSGRVDDVIAEVRPRYKNEFGKELKVYPAVLSDGTRLENLISV